MDNEINDLFRAEVRRTRGTRLEGDLIISRPVSAQVIIGLLLGSLAAGALWIGLGTYPRVETVKGIIVTNRESVKIVALRPGLVTRLGVREGQTVTKGQPLAVIQVDLVLNGGERTSEESIGAVLNQRQFTEQQIKAALARRQGANAGLESSIIGLHDQLNSLSGQIASQMLLISSLQEMYDRYRPVAEKGFISQTEMDRRKQAVLVAQGDLARLKQQQASLRAESAKASAEIRQVNADSLTQLATAHSASEGFRAQEAQLRGAQQYSIVAPQSGVVTALQVGVGRTVDASIPLMTIIPISGITHVELFAPTKAIGFIRPGQNVRILYDAFPYDRFGSYAGTISYISRVAIDPRQLDAPFRLEEPVYKIAVKPASQFVTAFGEKVPLQPGMTVSGSIILERRTFLDWLLEPLNAVQNRTK